jgi:hypothetical protein
MDDRTRLYVTALKAVVLTTKLASIDTLARAHGRTPPPAFYDLVAEARETMASLRVTVETERVGRRRISDVEVARARAAFVSRA